MSENKTTYESLDDKVAPEALLKDTRGKLQMVDGTGSNRRQIMMIRISFMAVNCPYSKVSSVCGCYSDREGI